MAEPVDTPMSDDLSRESVADGEDPAIHSILRKVCDLTGMGFAAVARVTEERWIACQVIDKIEFGLDPGDELRIKTTICDDIRACGNAVVIDQVSTDEQWRTHHTPMLYGFESYASFPVFLNDGSFYGTLCAIDPAPRALSAPAVVETMATYAREVATILDHNRATRPR